MSNPIIIGEPLSAAATALAGTGARVVRLDMTIELDDTTSRDVYASIVDGDEMPDVMLDVYSDLPPVAVGLRPDNMGRFFELLRSTPGHLLAAALRDDDANFSPTGETHDLLELLKAMEPLVNIARDEHLGIEMVGNHRWAHITNSSTLRMGRWDSQCAAREAGAVRDFSTTDELVGMLAPLCGHDAEQVSA